MYNEAFKREFVKNIEDNVHISMNYVQNVFNKIDYYEKVFEKDCCNFNEIEIKECLGGLCHSSVDTLLVIKSLLSRYTKMCIEKGLSVDNIDRYELVRRFELEQLVVKKDIYVSPSMIDQQLSKIGTGCDQFLWYGIYRGLDYEELLSVNNYDVNGDTIKVKDKTITDSKLCMLARKAYSEDTMDNGSSKNIRYYESTKILRPLKNAKNPDDIERGKKRLVAQFKRIKTLLDYRGNAVSLKMSGLLNLSNIDLDRDAEIVAKELYNNKELLAQYSYDKPRNALKLDIKKYYRVVDND